MVSLTELFDADADTNIHPLPDSDYVNTYDNPADLIKRGVSLNKFRVQFLFSLHDPSWLIGEALQ